MAQPGHPQLLDCTLRDGGLVNRWRFSDDFVRRVIAALSASGVELCEVGYKSSPRHFSRDEHGAWRFCAEEDLQRVLDGLETELTLAAMVDVGRVDPEDLPRRRESVIGLIRVACYAEQIEAGVELATRCLELGFDATINLMAVSALEERELGVALATLARSPVPTVYLVDSFGALFPSEVRRLVTRYREALPGKRIGIHAHNNLQLALANTIEAAEAGASLLDATLYGMGRGAGNCPIEALLAFLRDPARDLAPLLDAIQDLLIPLKRELEWGYHLPYLITGLLNRHPRSAIEAMAEAELPRMRELYRALRRSP